MTATADAGPAGLLAPDEPAPFEVHEPAPGLPVLLTCDHASARIPRALGTLGLAAPRLAEHIALDIGAAALTRRLGERLGAPQLLAGYSRLVIDCNRRLDDPTAFPAVSDGVIVPGNAALDAAGRRGRAEALYWPYHHAIRDRLAALEGLAPAPALIAIHTFTPVMHGRPRPWHLGVLWDVDPRVPVALLGRLGALDGVVVGDNEPYSGRHPADFTVDHHAEAGGLPHVSIEVRQDLVTTTDGVEHWSAVLAEALAPILDDPGLYTHWAGR